MPVCTRNERGREREEEGARERGGGGKETRGERKREPWRTFRAIRNASSAHFLNSEGICGRVEERQNKIRIA